MFLTRHNACSVNRLSISKYFCLHVQEESWLVFIFVLSDLLSARLETNERCFLYNRPYIAFLRPALVFFINSLGNCSKFINNVQVIVINYLHRRLNQHATCVIYFLIVFIYLIDIVCCFWRISWLCNTFPKNPK